MVARRPTAAAIVVSAVVALAMVSPFVISGTALGHDSGFHFDTWADAAHSWRTGVWFPRWAEQASWQHGEPRFVFYPPLSWMLGAALSFFLPWNMVPGAFVFLALTLAGVSMFLLARGWLPDADALFAGALYVANPYFVLVIYQRSAYAELLAAALFPLVVLYALRLPNERWRWRAVAPLALACGAIWLTNAPAALMSSYGLIVLLLVMAWRERSAKPIVLGGTALALGMMLAGVYIIPAMMEQPWVHIQAVFGVNLTPQENFLFTVGSGELHWAFNQMVSTVALVRIIVFTLAARNTRKQESLGAAWWPVVALGTLSSVLMVRLSAPLWHIVPKLEFIQFPWRWLVVLGVCVDLVVAADLSRQRHKALRWVATALALFLVLLYVVERSWLVPGGPRLIVEDALSIGYEGSAEYAPVATDHHALAEGRPAASFLKTDGELTDAHAQVQTWQPEERRFFIVTEKPEQLVLRLVSYPAWQVEVNGGVVATTARPRSGEMVVPLPAGKSEVRVRFTRTIDRTVGGWVSVVGLVLLALLAGGVARLHTGVGSRVAGSR